MYWSLKKLCNFQLCEKSSEAKPTLVSWKLEIVQRSLQSCLQICTKRQNQVTATYARVAWGEHRGKEIEKDILVDQVLNKKWTAILSTIKDKHGKTLQTSEEFTKRWTEYCQELFNKTNTNVNAELASLREISLKLNPSTINDQLLKFEIHAAMNKLK